jgi:hypothetical protein
MVQNQMQKVEWEERVVLDLQLGDGWVVEVAKLGDVAAVGLELAQGLVFEPEPGLHEWQVGSELHTHRGAFHSTALSGLLPDNISYTYTQYRHNYLETESPSWSRRTLDRCNLLEHLWAVWAGLLEVWQAVQMQHSSLQAWPVLGQEVPGHLHTRTHQCGSKSNDTLPLYWCTKYDDL